MTSPWIPIVSAAIGAGGAVTAQIVTASFTAKRETKRLQWDIAKQDAEVKSRDADRFLTHRHELYSEFIGATYESIRQLTEITRREYGDKPGWQELLPGYSGEVESRINRLRWNIRLVGSADVSEQIEVLHAQMLSAFLVCHLPVRYSLEHRHKEAQKTLKEWQATLSLMRAELRADEAGMAQLRASFGNVRSATSPDDPNKASKLLDEIEAEYEK